jgi:inosine triphosphate pyrophosphatase
MIYYVTGNKGKFEEAKRIISNFEQLEADLPEIQEIDPKAIISEKLKEAQKNRTGAFVVDDVSLSLECLGGLPGPLIKWFLKTLGNEGLAEITKRFENPKVKVVAMIGYADDSGEIQFFEGVVEGKIVEPRGSLGFGWDPIFLPEGQEKTYGEMTVDEKNEISHRRLALEKLRSYLDGQR